MDIDIFRKVWREFIVLAQMKVNVFTLGVMHIRSGKKRKKERKNGKKRTELMKYQSWVLYMVFAFVPYLPYHDNIYRA